VVHKFENESWHETDGEAQEQDNEGLETLLEWFSNRFEDAGDGVTTGEMGDGGLTLTTEALHNVAASAFEQRSEEEWQQLVLKVEKVTKMERQHREESARWQQKFEAEKEKRKALQVQIDEFEANATKAMMTLKEIREMEKTETKSEGPWPCVGPAQRCFTVQCEETKLERWYKQHKQQQQKA